MMNILKCVYTSINTRKENQIALVVIQSATYLHLPAQTVSVQNSQNSIDFVRLEQSEQYRLCQSRTVQTVSLEQSEQYRLCQSRTGRTAQTLSVQNSQNSIDFVSLEQSEQYRLCQSRTVRTLQTLSVQDRQNCIDFVDQGQNCIDLANLGQNCIDLANLGQNCIDCQSRTELHRLHRPCQSRTELHRLCQSRAGRTAQTLSICNRQELHKVQPHECITSVPIQMDALFLRRLYPGAKCYYDVWSQEGPLS